MDAATPERIRALTESSSAFDCIRILLRERSNMASHEAGHFRGCARKLRPEDRRDLCEHDVRDASVLGEVA